MHSVTTDGVEEVCETKFVVLEGYDGRFVIIGNTHAGRALRVVIEPEREERYYVVTARPASRRERGFYGEEMA